LHLNCEVIDISLKSIPLVNPEGWYGKMDDKHQIDILLDDSQLVIKMTASAAHIDEK
jgi:hypothetical protein